MNLTFLGGVGTVTGSRFLLEGRDTKVLIDAGLFQGAKELRLRNWEPSQVPTAELTAVVISHAHLDHVGYLPVLVEEGYTGPVFASPATIALAEIILRDSAKLQEEDARFARTGGFSKHAEPRALYGATSVDRSMALFRAADFDTRTQLAEDCWLILRRAGHILGSTSPLIELDGVTVLASGDLGRQSHPLLRAPEPAPAADVVLLESTYGGRKHPDGTLQPLADVINRTVRRGGSVVIPAFAVDRTEVLLMALRRLVTADLIPRIPVYVDSPMALRALQVYRDAISAKSPDIRPEISIDPDPFDPGQLHEAMSPEESMRLNGLRAPSILISASGMATGGRVLHHLKRMLPDPRNAVILAGFQSAGTRGRALATGATEVKIHGEYVPVRAEVVDLGSFSVHADAGEVIEWLAGMPSQPRTVFVVHGEPDSSAALATRIRSELGWLAVVPRPGERVRLRAAGGEDRTRDVAR